MVQPVFLITDIFYFLFLACLAWFLYWSRSRQAFQEVAFRFRRRPLARVSLVLVIIYLTVAGLDCLHFRMPRLDARGAPQETHAGSIIYGDLLSVLDLVIDSFYPGIHIEQGRLVAHVEQSYSSPLARTAFEKKINRNSRNQAVALQPVPLQVPGGHWLGTDQAGGDIFYQVLKGIRTGIIVGLVTTLIAVPFAVAFGLAAGYFGGWVDDAIQFIYTTVSSVPSILLIISLIMIVDSKLRAVTMSEVIYRDDFRFFGICCILGILGWSSLCRLLRAETLKIKNLEYVQSAKAMGLHPLRIMLFHLLPNVVHIILISFILSFSSLVMVEVILQYINIGVPATIASWGRIIDNARGELSRDPMILWPVCSAFFAMFFLILPVNLLGDLVRDALDPRLKGGR